MNLLEAEQMWKEYLEYLKTCDGIPAKPNRQMMRILREEERSKKEYAEYLRLKAIYD